MSSFDTFISYHAQDRDEVLWLAEQLRLKQLKVFLDRDGLVPGQDWRSHLARLLPQVPCVIVCIGRHGFGPEQTWEIDTVLNQWRTSGHRLSIIPVFLRDAAADPKRIGQLANFTWIELGDRNLAALEALARAVRGEAPAVVGSGGDGRTVQSPFMGLRAFDESDAAVFFGRETLTRGLLEKVAQSRFVAVVGASGSGKSSLVAAGLLPRLRKAANGPSWLIVRMRPDRNPMRSLADAIVRTVRSDVMPHELLREQGQLYDDLVRQPQDSARATSVLASICQRNANAPVLLYIDQCEELFTLADDMASPQARAAGDAKSLHHLFIDSLVAIATSSAAPLHVIATLRADQFHNITQDARLNALFSAAQVNVGQMSRDELRQAMEEPARLAGNVVFEPGLVDRILDDMSNQAYALPLLEFVLERLWLQRDEQRRMLTREAYERSGRISHAIAQHADHLFEELSPPEQGHAKELFLMLVTLGQAGADSRRSAPLRGMKPELVAVAERLAGKQARLLTIDGQSVEIAHEALIREWRRLRDWLQTERKHLTLRQHLESRAQQWDEMAKGRADRLDEGLLDPGWPLQEAEELAQTKPHLTTPLMKRYIDASVAHAKELSDRERAKAEELRARERAQEQRVQRLWLGGMGIAACVFALVAAGSLYAFFEQRSLKNQVTQGFGTAAESSNRLVNDVAMRLSQTDRVPPEAVARVLRHARGMVEDVSKGIERSSADRRMQQLPILTLVDIVTNEAESDLARGAWADFASGVKLAREQLVEACRNPSVPLPQCTIRHGRLSLQEARQLLVLAEMHPRVTKDGKHPSLAQAKQAGDAALKVSTEVDTVLAGAAQKGGSAVGSAANSGQAALERRDLLVIAARASAIRAQSKQKEAILDEIKSVDAHKEAETLLSRCLDHAKSLLAEDATDIDAAFVHGDCQRMLAFSLAFSKDDKAKQGAKRAAEEAIQRLTAAIQASPSNVALKQSLAEAQIVGGWLELSDKKGAETPQLLSKGLKGYVELIENNADQFSLRNRYIFLSRILFKESEAQLDEETKLSLLGNRGRFLAKRLEAKDLLAAHPQERDARLADLLDSLQDYFTLHVGERRYEEVVRSLEELGFRQLMSDNLDLKAISERELFDLLKVYYWAGQSYRATRRESQAMEAFQAIQTSVSGIIDKTGKDYETFERDRAFALHRYFYAWAIRQIGQLRIDNISDDVTLDRYLQDARASVKQALDRRPNNIEFKIAYANVLFRHGRRQEMRGEPEPALASFREAASLGSNDAIRLLRDRYLKSAMSRNDGDSVSQLERLRMTVAPVEVDVSGRSGILRGANRFTAYLVPVRATSDAVGAETDRLKRYYDAELDVGSVVRLRSIIERAARTVDYTSRDIRRAKHAIEAEERKHDFGGSALTKLLADADYSILNSNAVASDYGRALQSLDEARTQLEGRIKSPELSAQDIRDWGLLAVQYLRLAYVDALGTAGERSTVATRARASADSALRQAVGAVGSARTRPNPDRKLAERRQLTTLADAFYRLATTWVSPVINTISTGGHLTYSGNQSYQERAVQMYEELARKAIEIYYAAQDPRGIDRQSGRRIIELERGRAQNLLKTAQYWTKPINPDRARQEDPRQRAMDAFQDARSLLTQITKTGGADADLDNLDVRILMGMAEAHAALSEQDASVRLASQAVDVAKRSVDRDRGDLDRRRTYAEALEKLGDLTSKRGKSLFEDAKTVHSNSKTADISNVVKNLIRRSEEDLVVALESYKIAVRERAIILQLDLSQMDSMCVCQVGYNISQVAVLIEDAAWLKSLRDKNDSATEAKYLKEAYAEIEDFLNAAIQDWGKIEQRQAANSSEIDEDTALLRLYQARARDILAANKLKKGDKSSTSHQESIKVLDETTKLMRLIADQQPVQFIWEYGNALSNLSWSYFMTGQGQKGRERIEEAIAFLRHYYFDISKADPRNIRANHAHAALVTGDVSEARRRYDYVGANAASRKIWRDQLVGDLTELLNVYPDRRADINALIQEFRTR